MWLRWRFCFRLFRNWCHDLGDYWWFFRYLGSRYSNRLVRYFYRHEPPTIDISASISCREFLWQKITRIIYYPLIFYIAVQDAVSDHTETAPLMKQPRSLATTFISKAISPSIRSVPSPKRGTGIRKMRPP